MNKKQCQAMTTKKRQCRCQAVQYIIHADDGGKYLACRQHANYLFRPYPRLGPHDSKSGANLEGK